MGRITNNISAQVPVWSYEAGRKVLRIVGTQGDLIGVASPKWVAGCTIPSQPVVSTSTASMFSTTSPVRPWRMARLMLWSVVCLCHYL